MFGPPMRSLMNAIFVPSGDQVGSMSCLALVVSRVWPEPSAFITQISVGPPMSRLLWKAIFVPSGDHAGAVSSPLAVVRRIDGSGRRRPSRRCRARFRPCRRACSRRRSSSRPATRSAARRACSPSSGEGSGIRLERVQRVDVAVAGPLAREHDLAGSRSCSGRSPARWSVPAASVTALTVNDFVPATARVDVVAVRRRVPVHGVTTPEPESRQK